MTPNVSCQDFERQLYHFQADEVPEDLRLAMMGHLEVCEGCAHRLAAEDTMLEGLRARMKRAEAPAELKERVRAALREETPAAPARSWSRATWLLPLAASILVALFLIPGLTGLGNPAVLQIDQEVTVVDLDCDVMGKSLEAQRKCKHPHHLNALKVGDGQYWSVSLDEDASRRLTVEAAIRGHRLRVKGQLYPEIQTLHVEEYEDLGFATLAAYAALPPRLFP